MAARQSVNLIDRVRFPTSHLSGCSSGSRAPVLGTGGRWFDSSHPDQLKKEYYG